MGAGRRGVGGRSLLKAGEGMRAVLYTDNLDTVWTDEQARHISGKASRDNGSTLLVLEWKIDS